MLSVNSAAGKIVLMFAFAHNVMHETTQFRILAPEFICPKDQDSAVDTPDSSVITIKTDELNVHMQWSVRWEHLITPSQRFTLLLWRTVRALEAKLNGPQAEPFVYIIDHSELLIGVNYIFNVTAIDEDGIYGPTKCFEIDNTQGDQVLMIEGRSDRFSVAIVGSQVTYADITYIVEAQVTTCHQTQDYYFIWTVISLEPYETVNTSETNGCRLEVPAFALKAGLSYDATCQVYKHTTGELITQTSLPFQVQHRGLEVSLNVDRLVVPTRSSFTLESLVINHDYFSSIMTFVWSCMHANEPCEAFESIDHPNLNFPSGLTNAGRYDIMLSVNTVDQIASANASVIIIDARLPVLQVVPVPRVINAPSVTSLVANASHVAPACTLTWYFASLKYVTPSMIDVNDTCDICQHGHPITDSLTVYSLEENFLNELADFSNETEWRQVTAQLDAATSGRARLVAQCGCSLTFGCDTEGIAYADIEFHLNTGPKVGDINISPEAGSALETVFRLSTLAAIDHDTPLRYSFYTGLGSNDSLLLASYMDHLAVETFLPYLDGTTDVWVEVCDSLGACSSGAHKSVQVLPGEARTVNALIDDITGHVRRCELISLRSVVGLAVITYTSADQTGPLKVFTAALQAALLSLENHCIEKNFEQYSELIRWLRYAGIDVSSYSES